MGENDDINVACFQSIFNIPQLFQMQPHIFQLGVSLRDKSTLGYFQSSANTSLNAY